MADANDQKGGALKAAIWGGVIAGVITAATGVAGQYFIGYRLIEKPKLDADAQTHLNQLVPILETGCTATPRDPWTWLVVCTTRNTGANQAIVGIKNVTLVANNLSPDRKAYQDGQGFHILYQDDVREYQSIPTTSGELRLYLRFDDKIYPKGIGRDDLDVIVTMRYRTPPEIISSAEVAFSLSDDDVQARAYNGFRVEAHLPLWMPRAARRQSSWPV
ncbi:hypothetical protein V4C53_42805 [Paraburkholderia azotifigens]|uniref:hypothetical protein n=1 Tax=Paraburkholderia azotifigens TaxID=2057004 RepID=UPI00317A7DED